MMKKVFDAIVNGFCKNECKKSGLVCAYIRSRLRLMEGTMVRFDRDFSSFTQISNITDM